MITIRAGDRAIAARRRTVPKDQEFAVLSAALERGEVLRGVAERARQLGHEIVRWVAHDEESIAMCPSCSARIYVRLDVDPPSPEARGRAWLSALQSRVVLRDGRASRAWDRPAGGGAGAGGPEGHPGRQGTRASA